MKILTRCGFALVCVWSILATPVFGSDASIVVAVIDAPVDYGHAWIADAVDVGLLSRLTFSDGQGVSRSWYDINQDLIQSMRARIHSGDFREQIAFMDALAAHDSGRSRTWVGYRNIWLGHWRMMTSKRWRKSLNLASHYLHGTHVAGLTMSSELDGSSRASSVRLISFPLIGASARTRDADDFTEENERADLRAEFAQLTAGLTLAKARVVNLSFASSDEIVQSHMRRHLPLWESVASYWRMREQARTCARIYREELERFFLANPETVFVLAAGNERLNLARYSTQGKSHTALAQAKNLLVVASVGKTERLSGFSNRDSGWIDLAAPGEGIVGPRAGGGVMHMSGTSMAAPLVTQRVAQIIAANPSLNPAEAISELLDSYTHVRSRLIKRVAGGRVLKQDQECRDLLERDAAA